MKNLFRMLLVVLVFNFVLGTSAFALVTPLEDHYLSVFPITTYPNFTYEKLGNYDTYTRSIVDFGADAASLSKSKNIYNYKDSAFKKSISNGELHILSQTNLGAEGGGGNDSLEFLYCGTIASTPGKYVLEFKLKADTTTDIFGIAGLPIWKQGQDTRYQYTKGIVLDQDGKIQGTDISYRADDWMQFKMIFDNTNGTTNVPGKWTVWFDGTKIIDEWDATKQANAPWQYYNRVVFYPYQSGTNTTKKAGFHIKDFSLTRQLPAPIITDIKADSAAVTDGKISLDTSEIEITLDRALTGYDGTEITATLGDNSIASDRISYDATKKTVAVTLPESYGSGETLKVDIAVRDAYSGALSGTVITKSFVTYDPLLQSFTATESAGVVTVNMTFNTSEFDPDAKPLVIACTYNDIGEITAIDTMFATGSTGSLTLNAGTGFTGTAKLYIFEGNYLDVSIVEDLSW